MVCKIMLKTDVSGGNVKLLTDFEYLAIFLLLMQCIWNLRVLFAYLNNAVIVVVAF